jgi:biotin synthase
LNGIDEKEALALLECRGREAYALLEQANQVRIETKGYRVELCGVINAKSGMCPENCKFCPQSVHADSNVDCYDLVSDETMITVAAEAAEGKVCRFGIVTSGERISDAEEVQTIVKALTRMEKETGILPCASLGNLTPETMKRFKAAGLTRYHCNVETAKSFFDKICTTHKWEDSVNTIETAKALGLTTCSGGIFGMGESLAQRVEMLSQIRALDVD